MKALPKKRNPWSHKGDNGYVLIVGGSKWYSGSVVFNAVPALRVGADITTIVAPKRSADIAASFLPDLIAYPLAGDFLRVNHVKEIVKISHSYDSLIIGGGLGVHAETKRAVIKIIKKIKLPTVIDADALKLLKGHLNIIKGREVILTPNSPEFKKITADEIKAEVNDRKSKVKKLAKELKVTIVLKGNQDVISDGNTVEVNKTGTSYMAKGGFGDTLAGIAGSLLAQGYKPFVAANMAAEINGKAGQLAAKKYGAGLMASDIFEYIPQVINK